MNTKMVLASAIISEGWGSPAEGQGKAAMTDWRSTLDSAHGKFRIIEQVWLEGIFKGALIQSPCNKQEHLQLDKVA